MQMNHLDNAEYARLRNTCKTFTSFNTRIFKTNEIFYKAARNFLIENTTQFFLKKKQQYERTN